MRIIAGMFRGRELLSPKGNATRPITDRVKQSLFDILSPVIPGAVVYDCFAGTGSLGLESLSRGAGHVTFFEMDRSALTLLKKNIAVLKVETQCAVVGQDIFRWVGSPNAQTNVIFLDPPYRYVRERTEDLQKLAEALRGRLATDGVIVFRHDAADSIAFPNLATIDARQYGSMALEFLRGVCRRAVR